MDDLRSFPTLVSQKDEQLGAAIDRVLAAARPGAVFSPPVVSGNFTIITASEVTSGGGFGSGGGYGQGGPNASGAQAGEAEGAPPTPQSGGGFGGGGGGGAMGRPVAVIVIGPDGVQVKPIVDATKIAIAVISAWVGIGLAMRGMRRRRRDRLNAG